MLSTAKVVRVAAKTPILFVMELIFRLSSIIGLGIVVLDTII